MALPPLKLYLFRHGETDMNAKNIVQGGGIDASLNEEGIRQAERFFAHYQHVPFEAVYTSTLIRTFQTVEPFITNLNLPHFPLVDLRELSWGELEGTPHSGPTETQMTEVNRRWISGDYEAKIPGGESAEEVLKRIKRAYELILSRHKAGNVLICTHGRVIRIQLAWLLGYPLSEMVHFKHQNTSLNVLVKAGTDFYAETLNSVVHLEADVPVRV